MIHYFKVITKRPVLNNLQTVAAYSCVHCFKNSLAPFIPPSSMNHCLRPCVASNSRPTVTRLGHHSHQHCALLIASCNLNTGCGERFVSPTNSKWLKLSEIAARFQSCLYATDKLHQNDTVMSWIEYCKKRNKDTVGWIYTVSDFRPLLCAFFLSMKNYVLFRPHVYVSIFALIRLSHNKKSFQKKKKIKMVQSYLEISLSSFIHTIFAPNFYQYVTVHLVPISIYKTADEKGTLFHGEAKT